MGTSSTKQETPPPQSGTFRNIINRYSSKCGWLTGENFLKDLEDDSVDAEILDEELRLLREQQPKTLRGKMTKILESSPVQIAMCVLVMLDAGVVVAEILLDLHAMRSQQTAATASLHHAMDFIWLQYPADLIGFEADTVQVALSHLTHKYDVNKTNHLSHESNQTNPTSKEVISASFFTRHSNRWHIRRRRSVQERLEPISSFSVFQATQQSQTLPSIFSIKNDGNSQFIKDRIHKRRKRQSIIKAKREASNKVDSDNTGGLQVQRSRVYKVHDPWSDKLLKITHLLHYASILILGIFVIQVMLRVIGLGSEFLENRLEVFDAIIVIASFTLDLVFLDGIANTEGEDAIAIIIVFLLWRILRVINGFMVTEKKRHEFRIKLQKKACRRMEKKLEVMESDLCAKKKEMQSLKNLCVSKGATERELFQCKPSRCAFQSNQLNTSMGLSSIASLSMGFTMSMKGRIGNIPVTQFFPPSVSPFKFETPQLTKCNKTMSHFGLKKSLRHDASGQSSPNFGNANLLPSKPSPNLKKAGKHFSKQAKRLKGSSEKNLGDEMEMTPASSFIKNSSLFTKSKTKAVSENSLILFNLQQKSPNPSGWFRMKYKNKKQESNAGDSSHGGKPVRLQYESNNKYTIHSDVEETSHFEPIEEKTNVCRRTASHEELSNGETMKQQLRRREMFLSSHLLHETHEGSSGGGTIDSENFCPLEDGVVTLPILGDQKKFFGEKMEHLSKESLNDKKKLSTHVKIEFQVGSEDSLTTQSHLRTNFGSQNDNSEQQPFENKSETNNSCKSTDC